MNKKAIQQQSLTYLFMILLVAMIILFGYRAISNLSEKKVETEVIMFVTMLRNDVNELKQTFDYKQKNYPLPAKKVCFFENEFENKDDSKICNEAYSEYDPVLCEVWKTNSSKNVYIEHPKYNRYEVEPIVLDEGYLCTPNEGGKVELTLEGIGDKVKISGKKLIYRSIFDPNKVFTVNVDLGVGWNMVSFPLILDNYSVGGAFSSIEGKYYRIVYEDHFIECDPPGSSNCNDYYDQYNYPPEVISDLPPVESIPYLRNRYILEEVDHTKGYLVFMDDPGTFSLTGTVPPLVEIELEIGRNDISFISPIEMNPEEVFGPLLGEPGIPPPPNVCIFEYDDVWISSVNYRIDSTSWQPLCHPFIPPVKNLKPGYGYAVFLEVPP